MRKNTGRGLMALMVLSIMTIGPSPKKYSLADNGLSDVNKVMEAEEAIAGAAMLMDKYLANEEAMNPEELLKLLFETSEETDSEEISTDSETKKEETQDASDEVLSTDALQTEPETVIETEPPVTEPETMAPTLPPVSGYRGLAICKAENYCNVRNLPGKNGAILGKIPANAIAQVVAEVPTEDGIWYQITSGHVVGYVKSDFFVVGEAAQAMYWSVASRIGTVNAVNLRLRSTPDISTGANVLTKLAFGTMVVIVDEEGDFYRIGLDEGFYGYLHKEYVDVTVRYKEAITLEEERQAIAAAEAARKEAERLAAEAEAARIEAQKKAEEESRVAAETVVKVTIRYVGPQKYAGNVLNPQDIEITIHYQDGHTAKNLPGWGCAMVGQPLAEGTVKIIASYANYNAGMTIQVLPAAQQPETPQPPAPQPTEPVTQPPAPQPPAPQPQLSATDELRQAICAYAKQFIGRPYVYGGSDLMNGTDCSGFTMRVYQHFGINITRTSRSQAKAGRQVSLDNIRPGDLLFFDTNGTITHVALYIGNGQIVHAANKELGILIMDAFYRMPCKAVTFLDIP